MRTTVLTVILAASGSAIWSANASTLDDDTLRSDAERLVASDDTVSLFSSAERLTIQALRRLPDARQGIDHLLASKATIEVTINPEARVSVRGTGREIPDLVCGKPSPLLVRVVNEAFVTSKLGVTLRDAAATTHVDVQPNQPHLTGASVEYSALKLSLMNRGTTDITLTFDAGPGTEDLGNRATLSLLVRCTQV